MSYKIINVSQETREQFQQRDGLDGPFFYDNNFVLYYDVKEGKYLNPRTDIYLEYDEYIGVCKQNGVSVTSWTY